MTNPRAAPLLGLLIVAFVSVGRAQTFACSPPDTFSQDVLDDIKVVTTDAALAEDRDLFALVQVAATEVEIVTDSSVCIDAARAYARAIGDTLSSRWVHVIRAGSRFVVADRSERAGAWVVGFVFDATFGSPLKQIAV